ncbi:MAG: dTDP-4-dehydrorhamnose reductase [Boseongicola sp.]|nr:dTDP-4-dehydrorhamnose reductase [Boseongicola sp.]NNL18170.1 dTDP-4-dehydrorhamnose reductase [Boseongicola sp.]
MRIALFGKTGQVATEVQRRAPESIALDVIGRDRADFAHPDKIESIAGRLDADVIINAVAYTAVDKAEAEVEAATAINNLAVEALAKGAATRSIPIIHISTDYVFDGTGKNARAPDAPTGPLSIYGATKLAGENAIRAQGAIHAILRTSWVFSAHGSNFAKTMLRLGAERKHLSIVADQVGGPTSAASIADAVLTIAEALNSGHTGGTYHFSGTPDASWADLAREIFAQAKMNVSVEDILTINYPPPAKRPLNSRLDCESLTRDFAITRPDWREDLKKVLKELGAI